MAQGTSWAVAVTQAFLHRGFDSRRALRVAPQPKPGHPVHTHNVRWHWMVYVIRKARARATYPFRSTRRCTPPSSHIVRHTVRATHRPAQSSYCRTAASTCYDCTKQKADSTLRSSRAVPHPSTNRALRRLTSEVGRDPVHSTRYGRQRTMCLLSHISTQLITLGGPSY